MFSTYLPPQPSQSEQLLQYDEMFLWYISEKILTVVSQYGALRF